MDDYAYESGITSRIKGGGVSPGFWPGFPCCWCFPWRFCWSLAAPGKSFACWQLSQTNPAVTASRCCPSLPNSWVWGGSGWVILGSLSSRCWSIGGPWSHHNLLSQQQKGSKTPMAVGEGFHRSLCWLWSPRHCYPKQILSNYAVVDPVPRPSQKESIFFPFHPAPHLRAWVTEALSICRAC